MRLGIRSAISALVLTSIVVSAVGVHLLWWRTAHQVSQTLANTINDQIVSAVGDELQSITTEARSSMLAVRTLLAEKVFEPRDAGKREVVFLSQLRSQPTISWVAFGWPDGTFFAGHKLGDGVIEMLEITADRKMQDRPLRICRRRSPAQGQPCRGHQIFRHRSGMVSRSDRVQRRTLVDLHDASQRRAAGGRLRGADRYRQEAGRRHRHHHRTDAGLEFPVAAHGRKIGRRLHPRSRRRRGRGARSERQRGGAAEDRSSAVSGRGRCDPQRRSAYNPGEGEPFKRR